MIVKAGFIGTGGISPVHLDVLKARKDVKMVALCDRVEQSVKDKQSRYGGRSYLDFNAMLNQEKLDAVWLCTPPEVREEPLIACAKRGIPVFCEKPAEHSAAHALQIATKLDKLDAKVQVGYVFRSNQVIQALKKRLTQDRIHLVQSFYGCGVSLDMSLPAWFYDKDKSGGALIDQATHNLDLLRFLFGEVVEVKGFALNPLKTKKPGYTIDETIALSLRFENGILASHIHTWIGDGWRNEIILSGEKALYRVNPGSKLLVDQQGHNPLKAKANGKNSSNVIEQKGSIYADENDVFIKMVKTGDWSINPSPYRDAVKTLQLTLICDKAVSKK